MNKICRTCLSGSSPLFPINGTPSDIGVSFCDMILSLAYVEIQSGDGLPEDICESCVEKTTNAYNFKMLCERSDAVMRETGQLDGTCFKLDDALLDTTPTQLNDSQQVPAVYNVTKDGDLMLVTNAVSIPQPTITCTASIKPTLLKRHLCATCGKCFRHLSSLRQHHSVHSSPSSLPRTHKRRLPPSDPPHPCPHCGKTFTSPSSLSSHLRTHSPLPSLRRPHLCPLCPRSYTRPSYLRTHLATSHRDPSVPPPRLFPCPYPPCTRSLPTKYSLQIHIKYKHSVERPHICYVCSKTFVTGSGLTEHLRIHTNNKVFSCSVCDKSFVSKQSLLMHHRLHTGEKPYTCPVCGEGFVSSSRRSDHIQRKHKQRSHVCPTCGKMFHLQRTLNLHMKIHDKIKPSAVSKVIVPEAGFEVVL